MKDMTSELEIVATSSASSKTTNDLGAATNSRTTLPDDQEAMTKATARPRRTRELVNHRHAYSATTTGTVAPRHPMPLCGRKTMTTTTPGHALHQVKTVFLASQVS